MGQGTTNWFQIGKGVYQGCILSPCLFNLYAEYITGNAGLDDSQAGIKIAGRNIKIFLRTIWEYENMRIRCISAPQICRWFHFNGRKWKRTKELIDERREWKTWLKIQYSKNENHGMLAHHFVANKWGKCGNSVGFHFLELQNHCGRWLQPQNWDTCSLDEKGET